MTYTIKVRGGGPIVADYECPVHGRFTETVDRDEHGDPPRLVRCEVATDIKPPPGFDVVICGKPSEWRMSAPLGRVKLSSASQGKAERAPFAEATDTRELGEGMPLSEWKKKRRGVWRDRDYRARKTRDIL